MTGDSDRTPNPPEPTADRLNVIAAQIDVPRTPNSGARERHVEGVCTRVAAALENHVGTDLVVLPELATIDYSRETFAQLEQLAEPVEGPSFDRFSQLARTHRTALSYGFARRQGDGFTIAQAVIDASGALLGCYDKMHLAQYGASMEKDYFRPGDAPLSVDIGGFSIGLTICYDIRFPELWRALTLEHECTLIVHPSAFFQDESYATWEAFITTRALENQVYVLSVNRAGENWGGSMFCPPWVDEHHPLDRLGSAEQLTRFVVSREQLAATRRNYSFLHDRKRTYDAGDSRRPLTAPPDATESVR
ncbi:MAG: carbon-nitrogen hydrolase family protein [Pseudomonadota bacterium]